MNLRQLCGYHTLEEAYHCAELLKEQGIECVLSHRGKGLFGDPNTADMTWVSVPEEDFERAKDLTFPPYEIPDVELELQCPQCKSLKVLFGVVNPTTGRRKVFTWPWDRQRFFCEDCRHMWDRRPAS